MNGVKRMGIFEKKAITIKEVTRSEFAMRLQQARKNAKLTQTQVAEAVFHGKAHTKALSTRTISHYERDISIPTVDIFAQLCKLYGVTPNDLLL